MNSIDSRIPAISGLPIIFIAGPVSSGKTFFTKQLVKRFERCLVIDNGANYLGTDYEHIWGDPQKLAKRLEINPHYYRLSYHPEPWKKQEDFHWCFACTWCLTQPRWIVIEEAHEFCSNNAMDQDMEVILRYARHNLLGVIATSQRIADIDKLMTSVARIIVLFRSDEYWDIDAASKRWGKEVGEALKNLRPCIYNDETQECEQEPECIIIVKGQGFSVVALGDKIKTGAEEQCQSLLEDQPQKQAPQSLEQDSGNREQNSQESTLEDSVQT